MTTRQTIGPGPRAARRRGALALIPFAVVAAGVGILAYGAGGAGPQDRKQDVKVATRVASEDERVRSEEAAAQAMVAMALARVAPPVDEAAAQAAEREAAARAAAPAQSAPAQTAADDAQKQRERRQQQARRDKPAAPPAPQPLPTTTIASAPEPAPPAEPAAPARPREKESLLQKVGGYLPSPPSPSRIVGAVGDGVSKLADLMPKF